MGTEDTSGRVVIMTKAQYNALMLFMVEGVFPNKLKEQVDMVLMMESLPWIDVTDIKQADENDKH